MSGAGQYRIEANERELTQLGNALNEVVNGVHIPDSEFATRLGAPRDALRALLRAITVRPDAS